MIRGAGSTAVLEYDIDHIEKHIPCSVHAKAAVLEAYNQDEKSLYYYHC